MGLWSSGTTPHSHCGDGSSILPRSKNIVIQIFYNVSRFTLLDTYYFIGHLILKRMSIIFLFYYNIIYKKELIR